MDIKRSIQDIIPPARSRPIRPSQNNSIPPGSMTPPTPPTPPTPIDLNPNRPRGVLAFVFVLGGLLLIASIVVGALSTVFHRAYVTVTPHRFEATVNGPIKAVVSGDGVTYERVSTDSTKTKSVPATGSKRVEERASGTLTIYNAFNKKSERLITNTRFETKDGLIFRIHAPVVIPGYTLKAGLKVPGSIEVTVYADQPGEKYNVGLTDMTIPGLKGTEQFTLMFAKSKTPMAGGFVGERAIVDQKVRIEAVTILRGEVDRELREKIHSAIPADSVVFDSTVSISYSEGVDKIEGGNALISVSGIATAPAFDESRLANSFASAAKINYEGDMIIENPDALTVAVSDQTSVTTENELALIVTGTASLLATFDQGQLVKDLAGKKETDITAVRANYPAIESWRVRIYPFWRGSLPTVQDRIEVTALDPTVAP